MYITVNVSCNVRVVTVIFPTHYIVDTFKKNILEDIQDKKLCRGKFHDFHVEKCHYLPDYPNWIFPTVVFDVNFYNLFKNLLKIFTLGTIIFAEIGNFSILNVDTCSIIIIVEQKRDFYKSLDGSIEIFQVLQILGFG